MAKFPDFLKSYKKKAEALITGGYVREIEFSRATYQVQVIDPETDTEIWAFLQLDPKGGIKDCFCSCETGEGSACEHIAAAYLRLYLGHSTPLHQRFYRSLWNQLFQIISDELDTGVEVLKNKGQGLYQSTSGGKVVFSIKAKTKNGQTVLKNLLEHRQRETEETSLKFSNLSPEEILLWRQGRPSSQLRYELSFWSDIAKWLMLLQDQKVPYSISFKLSSKNIPNSIHISFRDVEVEFQISQVNLPLIIPTLSTVDSPLKVYSNYEATIKKITYNKEDGTLHIESKEEQPKKSLTKGQEGVTIENWVFVPKDGFYAKNKHSLLNTPILQGEQIAHALHDHYKEIEHLLAGTTIHEDPVKASYQLKFDQNWDLHIDGYIHKPGDLSKPTSRVFADWVYVENDGFYNVEDLFFEKPSFVVPEKQVAEFVSKNRAWFNLQEGFHTHLVNIDNQLTYSLGDDNRLSFDTRLEVSEETQEHHDFGAWVYIADEGFFSKSSTHLALPLHAGAVVEQHSIPLFLKVNKDELQLIPHFFSIKYPIAKSGLKIELQPDESIQITPEYEFTPEFSTAQIKFFDDYIFIPNEGFHEIRPEHRLPEHYLHYVHIDANETEEFIENELDNLKKHIIFITPSLIAPEKIELIADSLEESPTLGTGWELMKMSYQSEIGKVPVTALWQAICSGRRYLFSPAGLLNLTDTRFKWLQKLHKNRVDIKHDVVTLNTMEILRLDAFDEILPPPPEDVQSQHTRQVLMDLKEFKTPENPNLVGLSSHLRPYQVTGVNWLWFLYHHHLSGLLCDDMGLGKTHQAMALLAAVMNKKKKEDPTKPCHFLVVCPTSVIYHWQEKLHDFLPNARVCTFHGIKRSLGDFSQEYDILLTSYGIWRNDNEVLRKVPFEVAIFDEIQIAKNYSSLVYLALLNVNARMRIGLTGTPIENRLRELKSLFDVVLPHYMPDETEYREFFVKPIEKQHDDRRKKLMSKFIKPFVLRRKKGDVLKDLPEKTEEVSHCALLPQQYKLYNDILHQTRDRILKELQDEKNPIPYLHIFALLSALKQICNHPAVYYKTPFDYKKYQSGKWELFLELLHEARESQQKVVVFSQYLNMLDIIQEYLLEHNIGFATIRGSTQNRGEQVRLFNTDPKCEVFVGSLHAAGLGIDLTGGSVVIHYDRWWNAARENQATDRVHRIGQTRGVQVFKLVTKGTFEERIDTLISMKGKLMEDVVGVDDQQFLKQFDRKEIIRLLQDIDLSKDSVDDSLI